MVGLVQGKRGKFMRKVQKTKADLRGTLGDLWNIDQREMVMADWLTYYEKVISTRELNSHHEIKKARKLATSKNITLHQTSLI